MLLLLLVCAALHTAVRARSIAVAVAVHQNHIAVAAGRLSAAHRLRYRSLPAVQMFYTSALTLSLGLAIGVGGPIQVLLAARQPVLATQLWQAQSTWSASSAAQLWATGGATGPTEGGG